MENQIKLAEQITEPEHRVNVGYAFISAIAIMESTRFNVFGGKSLSFNCCKHLVNL